MTDDQVTIVFRPKQAQEKHRPAIKCSYEGCDQWQWARGYCNNHRIKLKKAGLLQNVRTPKGDLRAKFYANIEVNPETLCWEWNGYFAEDGYGQMAVGAESKNLKVHRYSYELFYGSIPKDRMICHKCNNKKCNNPDHLYAGTRLDNARDYVDGVKSGAIKRKPRRPLTFQMVMNLRIMYARGGHSIRQLARIYGIRVSHASDILKGKMHLEVG